MNKRKVMDWLFSDSSVKTHIILTKVATVVIWAAVAIFIVNRIIGGY